MSYIDHSAIVTFYATSPIHAGAGTSLSTIDLPIQRERHTNWPHIQATGVKGALRELVRLESSKNNIRTSKKLGDTPIDDEKLKKNEHEVEEMIFGTDNYTYGGSDGGKPSPGALSVSDAKLFAFPMRSNVFPFVWVTSPSILKRFFQDLSYVGKKLESSFSIKDEGYQIIKGENLPSEIILEEAVVKQDSTTTTVTNKNEIDEIIYYFSAINRLILISDEMFDYCVSCTEIQTQIAINHETGTAATGALRYQELLPADTVLYSVITFLRDGGLDNILKLDGIKNYIKGSLDDKYLQIGGDITLGRGICKTSWFDKAHTPSPSQEGSI